MKGMAMKNKTMVFIVTCAILMFVIFQLVEHSRMSNLEKDGVEFNESSIYGKLTNCDSNKKGTFFSIDDTLDYWVLPTRKLDKRFQMLCRDAELGDLILKEAFANELNLVKMNGDTIKYFFVKYEEDGKKKFSGDY